MRSTLKKTPFLALILTAFAGGNLLAQTPVHLISYNTTWKYEQSGANLGTAWRASGFNDTAWASGPGALGFPADENLLGVANVQTVFAGDRSILTYYFRYKFQWNQSPQGVTLMATNLIDDGAIFYLNGTEVGRIAMPSGAVAAGTLASRADDISGHGIETLDLSAATLVQGENVLAVEVHQGGTSSSDIIFATSLWATPPPSGPAVITSQPASQAAVIGGSVTFTVGVGGTPPYMFQWRKNGAPIGGANGQSYTINNATLGDAGEYTVVVSNASGSDTSQPALLSVTAPPVILLPFNKVWRFEDSGTDLGTAWRASNFNDASWKTGPGPFGFETAAIPVPIATAMADLDQITYYLRTTFTFTNEPLDVELTFTNELDDGSIIYINGEEVLRVGMATGPVTYTTAAGRTVGDAGLETMIVPAEALVKGVNTIAVEAHQVNTTSSDIVMGLSLAANFLPPTPIIITNQPKDLVIEELKTATFEVEITGNAPRFQWFKDGAAIMGANARRYTISSVGVSDQGKYSVVVSNAASQVTSRMAMLTVLADTNGPILLSADGTLNLTDIVVSFDESVRAMTATNIANYTLSNASMGGAIMISRAVLTNMTNVVLTTTARVTGQNYLLFARNVTDINPRNNVIAVGSVTPVTALLLIIRPTDNWDFYDPVPPFDPPITTPAWRNFGFNPMTEGWGNGPGAFVYPASQDLPVQDGTILSQGSTTKYFRNTFEFTGSPAGANLRLRHVTDDGAIFYLNGDEFFRYNMPDGPVDGDTPSLAAIGVATFVETNLPAERLRFGANLLAVEVHGRSEVDSDWVFALDLQATIDSYATGAVVIARQPRDLTVMEGQLAKFDFAGVGGSRFQWQRNNTAIPGETNSVLIIDPAPLDWNGSTFRVVVSNTGGSRTSSNATLTVLIDTVRPKLLSAFGLGNKITVQFNEPLDMATATAIANYKITNGVAGMRGISSIVLSNGNTVILTTMTPAQVGDVVVVNGVKDGSTQGNSILPNSAVTVGFEALLLPIDAEWKYDASDTDFGTAWRDFAFNDASWSSGPALLGQEGASLPVILRTAVPAPGSGGPLTTYYRTHFNFPGTPAGVALTINHIIDDGAVFFLNGQEIYRIGVNAGEVHGTLSSRVVGDAVWEGPFVVAVPSLRSGDNVLAVAIHQQAANSSDTVFGAELLMDPVFSTVIEPPTGGEVSISIRLLSNGMVQIDWAGVQLQQTAILEGNPANTVWTPVAGQPKPYVFTPSVGGKLFFRAAGQ